MIGNGNQEKWIKLVPALTKDWLAALQTEKEAQAAANKKLAELNKTQPVGSSGGQSFGGIQDRVFIVRPDGTMYRYGMKL